MRSLVSLSLLFFVLVLLLSCSAKEDTKPTVSDYRINVNMGKSIFLEEAPSSSKAAGSTGWLLKVVDEMNQIHDVTHSSGNQEVDFTLEPKRIIDIDESYMAIEYEESNPAIFLVNKANGRAYCINEVSTNKYAPVDNLQLQYDGEKYIYYTCTHLNEKLEATHYELRRLNPATGEVKVLTPEGFHIASFSVDEKGNLLLTNGSVYVFVGADGTQTIRNDIHPYGFFNGADGNTYLIMSQTYPQTLDKVEYKDGKPVFTSYEVDCLIPTSNKYQFNFPDYCLFISKLNGQIIRIPRDVTEAEVVELEGLNANSISCADKTSRYLSLSGIRNGGESFLINVDLATPTLESTTLMEDSAITINSFTVSEKEGWLLNAVREIDNKNLLVYLDGISEPETIAESEYGIKDLVKIK